MKKIIEKNVYFEKVNFTNPRAASTHCIDSSMVLRRSSAFTRICSKMTSRLSRSISAFALISAFTRAKSFVLRNSASCSTVSVHNQHSSIKYTSINSSSIPSNRPIVSSKINSNLCIFYQGSIQSRVFLPSINSN